VDIVVRVKANKHQARVIEQGNEFLVEVDEPAHDNKANERLIEILADHFGIAKSRIYIKSGHGSSRKMIVIE
jgi:uncharacterized protein YggU (UPF0235/DUF167 family)